MKRIFNVVLFAWLLTINLYGQEDYSLNIVKHDIKDLPQIHSYAHAVYEGKLIIIGGRTGSPSSYINFDLFLVDPENDKFWQTSLETYSLPSSVIEHLSSCNSANLQMGDYLYLAGGLGYRTDADAFGSMPYLTRIDLSKLCSSILKGKSSIDFVCQIENEMFASMESSLLKTQDEFYLVGGFSMNGFFNQEGELEIIQKDMEQYYSFTLSESPTEMLIDEVTPVRYKEGFSSSAVKALSYKLPDSRKGIVFIQNEEYINDKASEWLKIEADHSVNVIQNQGKVPFSHAVVIPFYDNVEMKMYTYLVGGCKDFMCSTETSYTKNRVNKVDLMIVDEAEQISIYTEVINELILDGKDGIFIPVSKTVDGILNVSKKGDQQLIGYIYGGSTAPSPMFYSDGTTVDAALNQFFEVYISKEKINNHKF